MNFQSFQDNPTPEFSDYITNKKLDLYLLDQNYEFVKSNHPLHQDGLLNIKLGIIKNFDKAYDLDCEKIISSIKNYRQTQPKLGENLDRLSIKKSYVRRDDSENINSKTPHTFDSYFISTCPDDLLSQLTKKIFSSMRDFDWAINSYFRKCEPNFPIENQIFSLRPQIIHYPVGGGWFDWHCHQLKPQYFGLILNLSKKGKDYEAGSTKFRIGLKEISIDHIHDQGALAFFRYDLEHCVEHIKPLTTELNWNLGRWSAVMPLI